MCLEGLFRLGNTFGWKSYVGAWRVSLRRDITSSTFHSTYQQWNTMLDHPLPCCLGDSTVLPRTEDAGLAVCLVTEKYCRTSEATCWNKPTNNGTAMTRQSVCQLESLVIPCSRKLSLLSASFHTLPWQPRSSCKPLPRHIRYQHPCIFSSVDHH